MNNKITKNLGIIIATVSFSLGLNSCVKTKIMTDPPVQTEQSVLGLLTLTTTSDKETKLNKNLAVKYKKLAEKSKKLAEYALTKEKALQISETAISVYSSFELDGVGYSLSVIDINEKNKCAKDVLDTIQIGVYFPWENHERKTLQVRDTGLDGRVDLGDNYVERGDDDRKYFDKQYRKGLEHREFYQKELENLLDKLINFYKSK